MMREIEMRCPVCQFEFTRHVETNEAVDICGQERPSRDVLCQLPTGHEGRHRAVVFWEQGDEMSKKSEEEREALGGR